MYHVHKDRNARESVRVFPGESADRRGGYVSSLSFQLKPVSIED